MPSIQILSEADHKIRADTLMNSLAHDAVSDIITVVPAVVAGLSTLVLWGHGNDTALCGRNAQAMIALIKAWRDINPGLRNVEIITCNSRHFVDHPGGVAPATFWRSQLAHPFSRINNSMAKQIKRGLKYSSSTALKAIKLKSMPESTSGSFGTYSILYWQQISSTWCYCIGDTEPGMFKLGAYVAYQKKIPIDLVNPHGAVRAGDFVAKLAAAKIDYPAVNFGNVSAGILTTLRGILVDIN
ncbi:hypothetical protein [Polymorphobacter megasporae]|uniref:hypothetical protein n=1 Tax=Glacieibacterium megasporae TaxID=2835787 RepID=UPI001C1E138F|nr:hypothetical protein [Polymorphobacter megasporae]UAJ09995.1 hypothetical protein KTC28_17220 [Polymorphobacter megasporae]